MPPRQARLPWVTLGFVAAAAAASLSPAAVDRLEYRHAAVAAGEWWRLAGAHLVHWSVRMIAVDLGSVLVLGAILERRSRRAAALVIVAAILLAGVGLHFLPPEIGRYRGASSVASALFVALALDLGRRGAIDARPTRGSARATRGLAAAMLVLFALKLAIEMRTGRALFAGTMGEGVTILPRAHLLGACGGVVGWLLARGKDAGGGAVSAPSAAPSGPSSRSS